MRLDLDAGGLTLIPDASIDLKPLPTLDPDDLYQQSLDAGAPAPTPSTPSSAAP